MIGAEDQMRQRQHLIQDELSLMSVSNGRKRVQTAEKRKGQFDDSSDGVGS
jgi:hypothetical protein